MDEVWRKTLIVYVPGYTEAGPGVRLRGYVRWAIDHAKAPPGDTWVAPPKPEERPFQSYPGLRYTFTGGGETQYVDMVEVPWQTEVTKLTSRPPVVRLWRGLALLAINFASALRTLKSSRGYAFATGVALLLLLLWLLFLAMSMAGGAEAARKAAGLGPFPSIPHVVKAVWHAFQPKGGLYFIAGGVLVVLSLMRIDPGAIADIADLYDRFTHDRPEPDSYVNTRSALVGLVSDALAATNDGSYARVVVLGHSFGALIACSAVAQTQTPVELITVGTYFSYLDNLDRKNIESLFTRVMIAPVESWIDFYSRNDWFASSGGYRGGLGDTRYKPRNAELKAGISRRDKLLGNSHRYYFEDVTVLKAIFEGQVPPS